MANPHRGQVPLKAGERTYTLSLSINALCSLEAETNRSIVEIILEMESMAKNPVRLKLGTVRTVLWATLQDHHTGLTIADAGDIIEQVGVGAAMVAAMQATGAAMPTLDPGAKGAKVRPRQAES